MKAGEWTATWTIDGKKDEKFTRNPVIATVWLFLSYWVFCRNACVYYWRQSFTRIPQGYADIAKTDWSLGSLKLSVIKLSSPSPGEALMYVCVSVVSVALICLMLTHAQSLRGLVSA